MIGLGLMSCRTAGDSQKAPNSTDQGHAGIVSGNVSAIGIEACDEYLRKFSACVSEKVTDETKSILLIALEQSRAQWNQALAQGMDKATVEQSCKIALGTAKQTMIQYQCSW